MPTERSETEPEPTLSQEVWKEAQETAAAVVNRDEAEVPAPKQGASFETEQPKARINPNEESDEAAAAARKAAAKKA